jgi:uncharacterized protein YjbI with pentapeptide repeats
MAYIKPALPTRFNYAALLILRSQIPFLALNSPSMSELTPHYSINTAAELLEMYGAGKRDFRGVELGAVNLSAANLKGVDLSYADLSGADLQGANLRGADLSYANLSEANLTGADLRGAISIGTNFQGALLEAADLREADYDPNSTRFPHDFDPLKAEMKADNSRSS